MKKNAEQLGRGINQKRNERVEKGREINNKKSGQHAPKKKVYA